jgi:hypothetical protein
MKRHRPIALLCALVIGLSLGGAIGCVSGTTQTTAGPRPSSTVQIQDAIADVLNVANDVQTQLVAKHDATPICSGSLVTGCDTAQVHLAHHNSLAASAAGLRAAYGGLIAWKQSQDPTNARIAFCQLQKELPDFEALAVQFGIIKQADVDKWGGVLSAAVSAAGGGCQ